MNGHSSVVEWIWWVCAVTAFILSCLAYREALIDDAFLAASGTNGPRRVVATTNLRGELARLVTTFVALSTSTAVLWLAPPPPPYAELPQSQLMLIAWIFVTILMGGQTLWERAARRTLAAFVAAQRPVDPVTHKPTAKTASALSPEIEP